jgi:HEAT repeat protein
LQALEKHFRASTWGKNPLLFSLAALVFVYYGSIPLSRARLYKQVFDAVLETRQKDAILRTMVRKVVSSLALELFQEKKRTFTYDDLLRLLPTIREQQKENWATEELARQLINSGAFEIVARGTYGFWHQTFLEYLTATELAQALISPHTKTRKQFWRLSRSKRTFGRWSEVLRLVVGILVYEHRREGRQKALEWLHALVAQRSTQEGDIGDLGLTLAIRSLSEIEETANLWKDEAWLKLEEAVANTWTEAVLEAADRGHEARQVRLLLVGSEISHFNPFVAQAVSTRLTASFPDKNARIRKVVLQALGKLGKYAPVNFLLQTLDDKHSKVREATAYALAELEEYSPVDALIQALESESTAACVAATLALGEMRRVTLLEHLLPGLDDEEYSVREATVKALGKLGEQAPIEELVEMLDDENDLVRLATVETLGAFGEKAYGWLKPLLDDPYDLVRCEVIEIMGKHTPVLKLIEEVTRPRMFINYSTAYLAAAEVLAELEEQEILDALTAVQYTNGQDLWALIQSIRESRQATPTVELIERISNFGISKNECLSAAYILGRRNEWEILERFFASVDNQHSFIRAIAVRILGRVGEYAPVKLLLEASIDKNAAVRLAAVNALEDLEEPIPPEAILVVELLDDEHKEIRASALQVLARVLDYVEVKMPLLETLIALSRDRYKPVRDAAKICLEKLAPRATVDLIDGLFRHEDLLVRQDSILIFGRYASFNQIVTSMQHSEPKVREAAIHVLGQRREQAAINLLFELLRDSDVVVHRAAIQALERLGQQEALDMWYEKDELYPLHMQTQLALRAFKEWQILAKLCGIEELLALYETGTIPLEYLRDWDASMQFYSELFGGGSLMAVNTQTSEQQKLTDPSSANLSEMYERLYRKALAMLKERATVEQLLVALFHENEVVRKIALQVLSERTPKEQLIAALDDESPRVKEEALRILGERTPIDLLVSALNDRSDIVREVALELLKQRTEHMPENQLKEGLESSSGALRASAVKVLEKRIPFEKLKAMLGDSEEEVRLAAADTICQSYPETLHALVPELAAVFRGEGTSAALTSTAKSFTVEIIEYMENASAFLINQLTLLLDWHYWEVRMRAAQVLGKLRRNIPKEAIRRLLELRNDSESHAVRRAADDALAEILSLEAGIEDE